MHSASLQNQEKQNQEKSPGISRGEDEPPYVSFTSPMQYPFQEDFPVDVDDFRRLC